jgi:tRNA dimethylallyltransferase
MPEKSRLITLLGPTAVGKTSLAARLAAELNAEVISADSRQVFRGMDIGTGKDRSDYWVNGKLVKSHLIDIADAGTEYSVFSFLKDFSAAVEDIRSRQMFPILCGGTGLYLEAVLGDYELKEIPENNAFRALLEGTSDDELLSMLSGIKKLHNTTDSLSRSRMIRALEIEHFRNEQPSVPKPVFSKSVVFGLKFDRETIRKRITQRLTFRLENGMIEEVQHLISQGISYDMMKFYGLEYKYVSMYLLQDLDYNSMFRLLNTAIHQFAKRQMTWFRRMERNGISIHWLNGEDGQENNLHSMLVELAKK